MASPAPKRPRGSAGGPDEDPLATRLVAVAAELKAISQEMDRRLKLVQDREDRLAKVEARMEENAATAQDRVKFDVGGRLFSTTRSTVLKNEDTYFYALLCSGKWKPEQDGAYFIDRDPRFFDRIMASLRTGKPVDVAGLQPREVDALVDEMDYYMMGGQGTVGKTVRWDAGSCGHALSVSPDGRTVVKQPLSLRSWDAAVMAMGSHLPSFQVRVVNRGSGGFMVGYVKATAFKPNDSNFDRCGWFLNGGGLLHSCDWPMCSRGKSRSRPSGFARVQDGDLIRITFDREAEQIDVQLNDVKSACVFTSVRDAGPIVPCLEFFDEGCCLAIED